MKITASNKIPKQNGHAVNRLATVSNAEHLEKIDRSYELEFLHQNAMGTQKRAAMAKEVDETIEVIHEYRNCELGTVGFGWRKGDGKIVEFNVPPPMRCLPTFDQSRIEEITLAESLEWVEHMYFADQYFGDPMQEGCGYHRWIKALRAAIA